MALGGFYRLVKVVNGELTGEHCPDNQRECYSYYVTKDGEPHKINPELSVLLPEWKRVYVEDGVRLNPLKTEYGVCCEIGPDNVLRNRPIRQTLEHKSFHAFKKMATLRELNEKLRIEETLQLANLTKSLESVKSEKENLLAKIALYEDDSDEAIAGCCGECGFE